jgi:hypothetical protein
MPRLHLPEGPYETGLALHRERGRKLTRAESFHPDEQNFLKGPAWNHLPLKYTDLYDDGHRTIGAYTSHNTYSERSLSSDHVHGDHYWRRHYETRPEAQVIHTTNGEEKNEEHGANVSKVPFDSGTLCDKCHGVNIESLTADGGYVHSTLDKIIEQAKFCHLCQLIFREHIDETRTLDRYEINLKIDVRQANYTHSDHLNSHIPFQMVLWISTRDIRPHEFPEGQRGRMIKGGRRGFVPPDPSCKYITVHGRPALCYTDENDLAREKGVPWLRDIGENTASTESLGRAKRWLEECLEATARQELGSVQMDQPHRFETESPARLIFIADCDDAQNSSVRLIETRGAAHSYATLSYCWGAINSEWLCTKQTVDQYLLGIDRKILPATLRDSIVITASLGIHYIWIDALCIIQDDTSDWAAESAKMGGIYHGSLVTIAAAGSSDSHGGCFNTVSRPRFSEEAGDRRSRLGHADPRNLVGTRSLRKDLVLLESRLQNNSISRLYVVKFAGNYPYDDVYEEEVVHSPLSTRAWVFQEQVLSRRIIYFAQSQLFWECEHCRLSEDGCPQQQAQQIYPILASQKPLSKDQIIKNWYFEAVKTYTSRSLTHKHDKLVAISAVAKATFLNTRIDYFAGLWKDYILQGLAWKRSSLGNKSRTYVCPSWSWASQDSSVRYDAIYEEPNKYTPYQPKVLEVHVGRDPKNHFGDVSSGYVKLDTWVTSGWVLRSRADELNNYEQKFVFCNKPHPRIWSATVVMDDEDYTGPGVTVAMISNHYPEWVALVLELLPDEAQTYRRIGILMWTDLDRLKIENPWSTWKQDFITIV